MCGLFMFDAYFQDSELSLRDKYSCTRKKPPCDPNIQLAIGDLLPADICILLEPSNDTSVKIINRKLL